MINRNYTLIDKAILQFNKILENAAGSNPLNQRSSPAAEIAVLPLTETERKKSARLMRVNHVGEVCAQALYQGQALTAESIFIQRKLESAAQEEQDHLAWCKERISELGGRISFLNPFWYSASFMIGALAGLAGDAISLGFLAETEHQVERHLTNHLQQLDPKDEKSRKILEQMRIDESQHALTAESAGAIELPALVKTSMRFLSKIMTKTAYWI